VLFHDHKPWASCLQMASFAWAWLFGGNYAIARHRFPRWLDRGIRQIPNH
jgi:hypothetical protein